MICWPMSAGQICFAKGRGSKLWGNGVAIGSTASSGQLPDRGAAIRQLAGFFLGFAPRRAVSVSFPGIGGNYSLKDVGQHYLPPKLPLSCACLRFFVSVLEPQKQKKSAQLKALRTFLDFCEL